MHVGHDEYRTIVKMTEDAKETRRIKAFQEVEKEIEKIQKKYLQVCEKLWPIIFDKIKKCAEACQTQYEYALKDIIVDKYDLVTVSKTYDEVLNELGRALSYFIHMKRFGVNCVGGKTIIIKWEISKM